MNVEIEKFNFLIEELKKMVQLAYSNSKKAHSLIFVHNNEVAALMYLNKANAQMYSAKSLYISNYQILEHQDIDYVFHEFEAFSNETLNNYSSDHSHQWTDIGFSRFHDALQESIFAVSET